jgi:hypothetical protein
MALHPRDCRPGCRPGCRHGWREQQGGLVLAHGVEGEWWHWYCALHASHGYSAHPANRTFGTVRARFRRSLPGRRQSPAQTTWLVLPPTRRSMSPRRAAVVPLRSYARDAAAQQAAAGRHSPPARRRLLPTAVPPVPARDELPLRRQEARGIRRRDGCSPAREPGPGSLDTE